MSLAGGRTSRRDPRTPQCLAAPSASIIERLEDRALLTDLLAPVVVTATPVDDAGGATFSHVRVTFDEPVAAASAADVQNYRLVKADGTYVAVLSAVIDATDSTGKTVLLTCTAQSSAVSYTVKVGGVADLTGNASPKIGRNYTLSATSVTATPQAMVVADFDNDGIDDIITAQINNTNFWFLKGIAGGSFATPTLSLTSYAASRQELTTADIDGDGNMDLISPENGVVDLVAVYFGNGDGTLSAAHSRGRVFAYDAVAADVDFDSDLDLIVTGSLGFSTYINPWNPLSDTPASQATVRSFETWATVLTVAPTQVYDLQVGDLNLDGWLDVVATPFANAIATAWLGTSIPGVFLPSLSLSVQMFGLQNDLADLNGDGRLDLVTGPYGQVRFGSAASPYLNAPQSTAFSQHLIDRIYAADLDSDGDLDLIGSASPSGFTNWDPNLYVLYNQGAGVFDTALTVIPLSSLGVRRAKMLEFRDVNGDGFTDVIGMDGSSGFSSIFVLKSQVGGSSAGFTFAPNHAPAPSAGGAYTIAEGGTLSLSAAGSTDPDGDGLTYSWDINNDGVFGDATGVAPILTWSQLGALGIADDGIRSVSVRATDPRGWSVTSTGTLTITNTPPTLAISGAATGTEGSVYTLTLSATGDPGADTVTSWTINWGDGTSSSVSGTSATHVFADNGNFTITATATDEDGPYNAGNSVLVAVANVKPTLAWNLVSSQTGTADITIEVTPSDPGANDTFSYSWLVTRNGVTTAYSTRSITFSPLAGIYTVTVVVNDNAPGDGVTRSDTIEVRAFQDLFAYSSGSWTIGQSTSTGFNNITGPAWGNSANAPVATGDFNGDGATDLLRLEGTNLHVAVASGTSFTDWGQIDLGAGTYTNLTLGDVNGDGRTDVLTRLDGSWYVSISTGNGFATKAYWGAWSTVPNWVDFRLADLNNDGKSDLLGRTSTGNWYAAKVNESGTAFDAASLWTIWLNLTWDMTVTVDVNGDGKADLLGRAGSDWYVSVSDGSSLGTTIRWAAWSPNIAWSDYRVGDFDGDKKTDILARHSNGNWWAAKSTGTAFGSASVWGNWNGTVNWQDVRIGDFNGDGKADIAGRLNGNWYVSTSTGTAFNGGLLWTSGWTASYSFVAVGNVYASGPAGAPVANYAPKATSGASAVSGGAAVAASTHESSLALFWSSTKDDERFAAAMLNASKA